MDETELVSHLIGDIYDAALDPDRWPVVLERMCQRVSRLVWINPSPPIWTSPVPRMVPQGGQSIGLPRWPWAQVDRAWPEAFSGLSAGAWIGLCQTTSGRGPVATLKRVPPDLTM